MTHEIQLGQQASLRRTITETDIVLFAGLSGDLNPVHIDEISARESRFGRRIAHGILVSGLISAVIGTRLPGPGSIYLKQNLAFRKPVFINDTITATAVVTAIREDKPIITLTTTVTNQDGEVCIEGEAVVLLESL